MELVVKPDADAVGEVVADMIIALVARRPDAVIGLATGSTPLPTYRALAAAVGEGRASFADVRFVMLDEYVGLPEGHPESYRTVLEREALRPLGVTGDRLIGPTLSLPPEEIGPRYEERLAALGGVDLQLLGIGSDGHIGFNEPTSSLASRTRWKTLTQQTRDDNARFFDDPADVPRHVITQGLGTIGECGHAVLVATGAAKAEALTAAVEGPVSAACPASVLQFHPHVTVVADDAAAAGLQGLDYYRFTLANKPAWQPF